MTGLADCNNFFVSCERSVDPSLNGKAVVVLSNNDGCAIARSNEAKQLGITMGQPAFEFRDLVRRGQLIALSGNHSLYHDISVRVHKIFHRYVPKWIDYSVDEAFLDFSGIPDDAIPHICQNIIKDCVDEEKIPLTIGVSYSKTLAKMASALGKKRGLPYLILSDKSIIEKELSEISIKDIWGIGHRIAKKLYLAGVYTAADFIAKDREYVRTRLGVNGEKSWRELQCVPCIELTGRNDLLQDSISETRTFPTDISDPDYIAERISMYTVNCSERLRKMNGVCRCVVVFLRTNRFHTFEAYQRPSITVELPAHTDNTNILVEAALAGFRKIYSANICYKRAGVELCDIKLKTAVQPSLFDIEQSDRHQPENCDKLMRAIDHINGASALQRNKVVKLASQIISHRIGHNDGFSSSFHFVE